MTATNRQPESSRWRVFPLVVIAEVEHGANAERSELLEVGWRESIEPGSAVHHAPSHFAAEHGPVAAEVAEVRRAFEANQAVSDQFAHPTSLPAGGPPSNPRSMNSE